MHNSGRQVSGDRQGEQLIGKGNTEEHGGELVVVWILLRIAGHNFTQIGFGPPSVCQTNIGFRCQRIHGIFLVIEKSESQKRFGLGRIINKRDVPGVESRKRILPLASRYRFRHTWKRVSTAI